MTAIAFLVLYAVGCVLAYGRFIATSYEMDEIKPRGCAPDKITWEYKVALLSWIAFAIGIFLYYDLHDKYFFKRDKDELWDRFYQSFD